MCEFSQPQPQRIIQFVIEVQNRRKFTAFKFIFAAKHSINFRFFTYDFNIFDLSYRKKNMYFK